MSLWHIIRFTTIRHLWLITIEPIKHPRRDAFDKWVHVGGNKLAVAWDPNLLHQFLMGGGVQQDQP